MYQRQIWSIIRLDHGLDGGVLPQAALTLTVGHIWPLCQGLDTSVLDGSQ